MSARNVRQENSWTRNMDKTNYFFYFSTRQLLIMQALMYVCC